MKSFFVELEKSFKKNPRSKAFFNSIFSFREFGNKTHGDMAEVLLDHYVNKYVARFKSKHIGKEKFRSKESEEDLKIQEKSTGEKFSLSIKNYGDKGPLQIRTDKDNRLFNKLEEIHKNLGRVDKRDILPLLKDLLNIHVLCFLYDERRKLFRVCVIKTSAMVRKSKQIRKVKKIKHYRYEFLDTNGDYMFEVRYGGATANALQRGIWTHTSKAKGILDTIHSGNYVVNKKFLTAVKELSLLKDSELEKFLKKCGC